MTDQDLREMIAQLVAAQAETDRQQRATDRQLSATDRQLSESKKETDHQLHESKEETDDWLRELTKKLDGLADKIGSFTEGMALPSMTRLLEEHFGLDNMAPRYKVRKNGDTLEIDVFGLSNTDRNVAVAVETKSHLREEGVQQMLRTLEQTPEMMPQHRDKKLYGLIAVVDAPEDLRRRVLEKGIYLADRNDETFTLQVPDDFEPHSFQ